MLEKDYKNQSKVSAQSILRNRLLQTNIQKGLDENKGDLLCDLGGVDYLQEEIKSKIYNPLFLDEKYVELGVKVPKSLLIYGIDGVGKKKIVECFCRQHKIPILSKLTFESPLEVRELFNKAKNLDKSVILIDKLDEYSDKKEIYFQINESIKNTNKGTLVIFIHKDKNVNLSFDNDIFVKIPRIREREEILTKLLRNVKTNMININCIAYYTPGFVARDLDKLVKLAGTNAVKRIANSSDDVALKMDDFDLALKEWKNIQTIITFDDIGAMEEVKEELKLSILLPSQFPDKFRMMGITKPSGILLHGPPGCGKTLIAKAVSNMSHCNFLSIKGPELITKYVGDSEKHLRDLFERAKNLSPCVLFFDEIDSLCSRRGKNEFGNRIVNQILTLLDGMEDRGEVYLIGATNRIDQIDKAMLRSGRFDKVIEVQLPEKKEAIEIFIKCIKNIPTEQFDPAELDFCGFSGADIAGVVKEAAILCIKDNFECENIFISKKYFEMAINKIRSMKREEEPIK